MSEFEHSVDNPEVKETLPKIRENRLGRIYVTPKFLATSFRAMNNLLTENLILTRCTFRYDLNVYEYTGFSDLFEPLPKGMSVPLYLFDIRKIDGRFDIKARKCEEGIP